MDRPVTVVVNIFPRRRNHIDSTFASFPTYPLWLRGVDWRLFTLFFRQTRQTMIEMQTSNHSMNLEIPEGLGDMLRDFTVSVLRQRPSDLFDFAAEYFEKARQQRRAKSVPMYIIVDDENEAQEPDPAFFKPKSNKKGRFARRQSVSAERYDPEADDDDEKVVHPKTDEQRERLAEAVQGILIFRSLDTEQMQDVLDAMFEKRVDSGQRVIEQGDDGDNFYVIDHGIFDVLVTNEGQERKVHEFVEKGTDVYLFILFI